MKDLFSASVVSETTERIEKLRPEDKPLWEKMSASEWNNSVLQTPGPSSLSVRK
jgi:hypothetical protein